MSLQEFLKPFIMHSFQQLHEKEAKFFGMSVTSISRSLQDNFHCKNPQKSIKYSQSYDVLYQFALLGSIALMLWVDLSMHNINT